MTGEDKGGTDTPARGEGGERRIADEMRSISISGGKRGREVEVKEATTHETVQLSTVTYNTVRRGKRSAFF